MAEVPAGLISTVLSEHYDIEVASIVPVKSGEMAYACQAIAADGQRWFVKARPDDPCWPLPKLQLDAALALTFELQASVKHAEVVLPILSLDGSSSVAFGGYLTSVFPFVGLQPLSRRAAWTDETLRTVASAVAEVQATAVEGAVPFVEDFELWHQKPLPEVLAGIAQLGADARPGQKKGQEMLAGMAGELARLIDRCTELQEQVRPDERPMVLCHTDLTPDNLNVDRAGRIHIVDWDQLQLGPPEFDVRWLFDQPRFEIALDAYEKIRGRVELRAEMFAFYVYRRYLEELAYYGCQLLQAGRTDEQDVYDVAQIASALWAFDGGMERWVEEFRAGLADRKQ